MHPIQDMNLLFLQILTDYADIIPERSQTQNETTQHGNEKCLP